MKTKILSTLFLVLVFAIPTLVVSLPAWSATYYIDYQSGNDSNSGTDKEHAWERCPGMPGFSGSYSHSSGDIFIFKGGVTWPSVSGQDVLTIRYSGASGYEDQYTVDRTWYTGAGWDYPVLDGGNASVIAISSSNRSNIIIDRLKIYNFAVDGRGIQFAGGSNITVRNCWIESHAVNGFQYTNGSASYESRLYFYNNHLKDNVRVHIQIDSGYVLDDVRLYNNLFEGLGTIDPGTFHSDGFMIGGSNPGPNWSVTNLKIYNNKFYGDWGWGATAQVYLNDYTKDVEIYNNIFAFENSHSHIGSPIFSPGLISIRNGKNIKIYSNTFSSDAWYTGTDGALTGISIILNTDTVDIKNNIFSRLVYGVNLGADSSVTNVTSDYNLYFLRAGGYLIYDKISARYSTLAAAQAAGYELHTTSAMIADPRFVALPIGNVTGSGDWRLQSSSPAIDKGASLEGPYNFDLNGISRPQSSKWDIGAYEYGLGIISPPKNLRVIN
jgi:hypothetical protein